MSQPAPHYETLTAPHAVPAGWLIVLHGAFGSGRNWAGVARRILNRRSEWGAALVDLREHGRSTDMHGDATLAEAANDLSRVEDQLQRSDASAAGAPAILGHSLGGKVALRRAADRPEGLRQVWIVDSTPAALPMDDPTGGSAWAMLQRIRRMPGPFDSRAAAVAELRRRGVALPVASWMAMNLDREESGKLRWRLDFDRMDSLLHDFYHTDLWPVVEDPPPGLTLHFIRAGGSSIITEAAARRIEAAAEATGRIHLHHVGGDHWLNVDNPDALADIVAEHLPRP